MGRGQVRQSQVITTYGPGAFVDLPEDTGIVAGLDAWPRTSSLVEVKEERLAWKIGEWLGIGQVRLYAPPISDEPWGNQALLKVWRFPEWFLVQEEGTSDRPRSRRLVHRRRLDNKERFEGLKVVAIRFVRACPKGHVDDIDWYGFVHGPDDPCRRQLLLDERGTSGDLSELHVRCECGKQRSLFEATLMETNPLGTCTGMRPWLGRHAREECHHPSRLLIRTASNAWFPVVFSALSLPDRGRAVEEAVRELWNDLQIVMAPEELAFLKRKPEVARRLAPFRDEEVMEAIAAQRQGRARHRPVKLAELDAFLAVPEGYGEDIPLDPDFHARRLPDHAWRRAGQSEGVEAVVQVHRLKEVLALVGFTRLSPIIPDVHGEYENDVHLAWLAEEPSWFPAVENHGEGIFVALSAEAVRKWLGRPEVQKRRDRLAAGHNGWAREHRSQRPFVEAPYVLLHTLSHLLIQSMSLQCGYPASSIRERIYADVDAGRYGILLYTASPDAEGTLGGLVQQARYIEDHLAQALRRNALCSNDPVCSQHTPDQSLEGRYLHGAACHGCVLVAETSCEMRNDYLDRALVTPILGVPDAGFFKAVP